MDLVCMQNGHKRRREGVTLNGDPAELEALRAFVMSGGDELSSTNRQNAATWPQSAAESSDPNPAEGSEAGDLAAGEARLHRPCANCRAARVLCDRHLPCGRCMRLNQEASCEAPPTVKRGRPTKSVQKARLEMLAADLLSGGLPDIADSRRL